MANAMLPNSHKRVHELFADLEGGLERQSLLFGIGIRLQISVFS